MNLLSLNRGYNYGMMNVIERRPFSELGDQQLLEQTRRLAANQRCLEVHILDHLDEIDRRGLALRRGFSSLFDYAVRELRFTAAAAQRRIQAMRLCRRHGWVRACLQSGELSMTSAAQLETTFAGAERAERQSHTGHRNVGQGRGHDQDHDSVGRTRQLGLPAAPGEADEQGERGHRSAPGFTPPAAECSGDVRERGHRSTPGGAPAAGECTGEMAAGNTPAVPVASRSGAQTPGAAHAGAPLPRPELNGNALPFPAPSCAPVAAPGASAGAGAPSSDEGPAAQLLPPTDFSASTPEPEPVMAAAESRHTACARAGTTPGRSVCGAVARHGVGGPAAAPAAPARTDRAGRRHEHPPSRQPAGRRRSRGAAAARHTARRGARPLHIEGEHRPGVRTGTAPAEGSHGAPRSAHVVGRPGGARGARGGGAARPARRRARAAPEGCGQRRRITATDTEGDTCDRGCGRAGSARRRIHGAGAESDRCCRGSRRTGSARRRILAAGAEPDPCRRGAGGPGSAPRRHYSGAAGRHRRYRQAEPDRGAGQRCSTESVSARRALGWRPCRWHSIGRARRYFGASVGARGTVGWRPRRRRSIGRARRYFGASVGARGTVGWRPCRWRSIGRVRRYFGAAVGARGTVGWRPLRRRSIGRVRRYFGAAVGTRGTVGWRPRRRRSIGRVRRYFGAAVRVRRLAGWLRCGRWCARLAGRRYGAAAGTRRVP